VCAWQVCIDADALLVFYMEARNRLFPELAAMGAGEGES